MRFGSRRPLLESGLLKICQLKAGPKAIATSTRRSLIGQEHICGNSAAIRLCKHMVRQNQKRKRKIERQLMEGVQENAQQPEHATIVRIDGVRFGDDDMNGRVKLLSTEVTGEFAGTPIAFWCNLKNMDGLLSPSMKLYQILEAGHGEGWTKRFKTLEAAIQALRGKYIAGTSVPTDPKKGGVGNNLKDGTIEAVPEDFEPET